jgi:hypothetical protein
MEPSQFRRELCHVLEKYGIDNLALEMEIAELIKPDHEKRTAESTKKEVAEAMTQGKSNLDIRELILTTIKNDLSLNPSGKDGVDFIEYAYLRAKQGEDIGVFTKWWIVHFPDPQFWSFARMKTNWGLAFKKKIGSYVTPEKSKWDEEFSPAPRKE